MLGIVKAEFVAWAKDYGGPRFHAVLCDPPYGLEFMGKDWDRVSAKEWGEAMLPLLCPGAIVLMFGGTRTWHKLATGMEEAGFEMWDTLMWLHGQGFPKAQAIDKLIDKNLGTEKERKIVGRYKVPADSDAGNAGKEIRRVDAGGNFVHNTFEHPIEQSSNPTAKPWSGHKTAALKPAWEPILCFRAPRQGKNYAELAMEYGSGALNVEGGRIDISDSVIHCKGKSGFAGGYESKKYEQSPTGRYPANLALDEESAEMLDEQAGESVSTGGRSDNAMRANQRIYGKGKSNPQKKDPGLGDRGGRSRFFYCAKASRSERGKANNHPTVKPIALTKWLATLLLPPGSVKPRRLLVPFAGSGSEMVGAIEAGWDEIVGVEQSEQYAEINSDLAVQRPLIAPAEAWRE